MRARLSKKLSYLRIKDGLLSLYLVQLLCQFDTHAVVGVTYSISLKYNSTRPSAILRPGTPAINHSKWPFDNPLSLSVFRTSLNSRFSSSDKEIIRPSLRPHPYDVRPGLGLCTSAVGNRPDGGGLCGNVCLSGIGAERGWKISSPDGCSEDTSGEAGSEVGAVKFDRFGSVGALIAWGRADTRRPRRLSIDVKRACTSELWISKCG